MIALYIHIPWCVRKCPYCDFNSHVAVNGFNEEGYVVRLIDDLSHELMHTEFTFDTVYFGGGTPSLFAPESFARILSTVPLRSGSEVTMEANPGTIEHVDWSDYCAAGINRISLGVQSLTEHNLRRLGRIHGVEEALNAVEASLAAGFASVNIDLMFGLPDQTIDEALWELQQAAQLGAHHISWYQLTIEPNTAFASRPPILASMDYRAEMWEKGCLMLRDLGYEQYEVSAYAQSGNKCAHNVNYWQFGDYVGIGAGAHGKLTTSNGIFRSMRHKQPVRYLASAAVERFRIHRDQLPGEFFMNVLRLVDGVEESHFQERTGIEIDHIEPMLEELREWGLMDPLRLQLTEKGFSRLDSVVQRFL